MNRVLVCPFGDVNLLVTLCEKLRSAHPGQYQVTYVCFTLYEREIYRAHGLPHVYIPPGECTTAVTSPDLTTEQYAALQHSLALARKHLHDEHREQLASAARHYAQALQAVFDQHDITDVILFNGRHNLFVSLLDQLATQRGCRKLVCEQGLFRPDYFTIDGRGVNYRNSVRSLDELLSERAYAYQETTLYRDLVALLPLSRNEPRDYKHSVSKWRLALAYWQMKRQPAWRLFLRSAEHRDLLESACFPAKQSLPTTNILSTIVSDSRYRYVVLCPLQVETDTQITLYSPQIATMQALIDQVSEALAQHNRHSSDKACVLFKVHPLEPRPVRVQHPDAYLINESKVPEILRDRCDLVITVNSTAGIEAIEAGLPVITLGQAFYNFPGVIHSHCDEPAQLARHFTAALTSPAHDRELQQQFIHALRTKYQVRLRHSQAASRAIAESAHSAAITFPRA